MTLLKRSDDEVLKIAQEYVDAGYQVSREPSLGDDLHELRPDLIARNPDETVVIEIVTSREMRERQGKLTKLAHFVASRPGWRLDVRSVGDVSPTRSIPMSNLDEVLEQARQLISNRLWIPGILTSWVVIEGTLRQLVSAEKELLTAPTPRAIVKDAFSLGLISRGTMDALLELASARNAIAHGMDNEKFTDLEITAVKLLEEAANLRGHKSTRRVGTGQAADELVAWFLDNYKEPADGVPHDSAEGGFQYINGGPYDPVDELQDEFPDVDEAVLEDAVKKIVEIGGWEWVKRHQY